MSDFVHGDQADRKSHDGTHTNDLEAGEKLPVASDNDSEVDRQHAFAEAVRAKELQQNVGVLAWMRLQEDKLDAKMGIETQGIDRILEEDKKPPSIINVFFLWWSLTCHVGTLPIGLLGPDPDVFGLSLGQSVGCIVGGTFLGALCTAYCGTLGPKLGLRAIATSRYSFGFYGAKLCSVLNIVIGAGFAVVNVVVVGQLLNAVSDYKMPIEVGCIIIAVLGYVISVFGFALIHTYEKYSWIMTFIIMLILIGEVGNKIVPSAPAVDVGLPWAGSILSFLALNFSSASGWCSMASDYYCNYPADTKSWKIFFLTLFGISTPTIFVTVIGACIGNVAFSGENPVFATAYEDHALGGLLRESFYPLGFSKFLLVLLAFSVLGNNVAVNYSSGLSLQLLGHYFHAVPRFIWSFLIAFVVAVLAIAGREHLSTIVSDFVSLLGYWTVSFTIVLLIEDQFFRRRDGYDLPAWDSPSLLPPGAAAVFALLAGYLAGGVTGMAQTWYVGPIAAKFGTYGGDVGVYLSAAITIAVYFPLRYYEKKRTGR